MTSAPTPWVPGEAPADAGKRHAPATLRNRDAIADVLAGVLPTAGLVAEIASGSGEHVVHFAARFPALDWQPTDPDPAALASIAAWRADAGTANILPPLLLAAAAPDWPVARADALLFINMIHIAPWAACVGLMAGAARLLGRGAPLILYGPFVEEEVPTADSNAAFDASLRARDPHWGLRGRRAVEAVAAAHGLALAQRTEMPANNLTLVFIKTID